MTRFQIYKKLEENLTKRNYQKSISTYDSCHAPILTYILNECDISFFKDISGITARPSIDLQESSSLTSLTSNHCPSLLGLTGERTVLPPWQTITARPSLDLQERGQSYLPDRQSRPVPPPCCLSRLVPLSCCLGQSQPARSAGGRSTCPSLPQPGSDNAKPGYLKCFHTSCFRIISWKKLLGQKWYINWRKSSDY